MNTTHPLNPDLKNLIYSELSEKELKPDSDNYLKELLLSENKMSSLMITLMLMINHNSRLEFEY